MLKSNEEIAQRVEDLRKIMGRVEEGFRFSREETQKKPDLATLYKFRDQVKERFFPAVSEIARELKMLRNRLHPDQAGWEEILDLLNRLEDDLKGLQARLVAVPSRLIRLFRTGSPVERKEVEGD